ncbi:MAG: hypothetical protein QMD97_00555 [Candidatus Aenigmarchaeota archaeon]|nr:hypothetical protein [Candidatus Aenigmarchaeota archaeon]
MSYRGLVLGAAGAVLIGGLTLSPHLDRDTYTATITDKQVKRYESDDKYLVFAELQDGSTRVFENTDSLVEFKFNSSDIQGKLKE